MTLPLSCRGRQRCALALGDARRDYDDVEHTRAPEDVLRAPLPLIALLLASCHAGSRSSDSARATRLRPLDSATAHRICEAPDSVLAGTKECVLRDQGRRGEPVRPAVPVPRR